MAFKKWLTFLAESNLVVFSQDTPVRPTSYDSFEISESLQSHCSDYSPQSGAPPSLLWLLPGNLWNLPKIQQPMG